MSYADFEKTYKILLEESRLHNTLYHPCHILFMSVRFYILNDFIRYFIVWEIHVGAS